MTHELTLAIGMGIGYYFAAYIALPEWMMIAMMAAAVVAGKVAHVALPTELSR